MEEVEAVPLVMPEHYEDTDPNLNYREMVPKLR
jgi:hypothetical protein